MAGRPPGSPNKDKPFRDALRLEIAEACKDDNPRNLRRIARALLDAAATGDIQAIKELADRTDGKPAQAVEMSGSLAVTHEDALDELDEPGTEDTPPAS